MRFQSLETRPARISNHWKRRIGGAALLLTLAPAAPAADLAAARNWLENRFTGLLSDTNTPVRTLALTALAIDTPEVRQRAMAVLLPRQNARGGWAEPGTPGALADQTAALHLCAATPAAALGARFLLAAQTAEGGWNTTLSRRDPADTFSTAAAVKALTASAAALQAAQELAAALGRARAFVAARQDPATGVIGAESSGLGHWASTVAGAWALATGGDPRDLALRRARLALAEGRNVQPAQQPLLALDYLPVVLAGLPPDAAARIRTPLEQEIGRKQQPDGHWPVPPRQSGFDEIQTTALLLASLSAWARPQPPAEGPSPLRWRPMSGGRILVVHPAEPADLILLPPPRPDAPLLVGFDVEAVATALIARARTADGAWQPWTEPLLNLARDWKAGPVTCDMAARAVSKSREATPLLHVTDFTEAFDRLDDRTLRRLASTLADRPVEKLFERAHAAWAHEDDATLNQCMETLWPAELRPIVGALRAKAAERLREAWSRGPADVVLDAWLALGDDGVLARLGTSGP